MPGTLSNPIRTYEILHFLLIYSVPCAGKQESIKSGSHSEYLL